MTARPAAGGGRWVPVAPERLAGWISRFAERHGEVEAVLLPDVVRLDAADGAVAECHVPFPPLRPAPMAPSSPPREPVKPPPDDGRDDGAAGGGRGHAPDGPADDGQEGGFRLPPPAAALVAHVCRERTVGVLLARLGGHAAGVFTGARLVTGKAGSRQVHGRSAAGGWSQQRFARRRDKQSAEALRAAADVAVGVLVPRLGELQAVVLGGDRRSIDEIRRDRRLAPVFALETGPFLTVPDPRLTVLEATPEQFRAVRIRLVDP
ncbi:acVLRF1 family peptidyl-tRNA hydrolase [Microbispora sp. H11081]|uniref:acVLRF1 family peptidyl-tRNA hydrolase n=1 Tax=Microbispora sp. H11081 TaxID=2729107 RepID=UPI002016600A|nr:acVLRF1 family peptidyl-tRNA hydrolase [Microbispora sp. H11081]